MNKIPPKIYTIGGSDANRLMRGEYTQLYKEIKGFTKPTDSRKVLDEQINIATKDVNLDFLQYDLEQVVHRDISVDASSKYPFLRSSLDGITHDTQTPCEARHTHEGDRMDIMAEQYYPQLQHYMIHTKRDFIYLSVIFGNRRFEYTTIDADYTYQKKLLAVEDWFYQHLVENKEPTQMGIDIPEAPAKENIKLNGMVVMDMTRNTKWLDYAKQLKVNAPYVEHFESCKKALKELVSDNCREARGEGVVITRNKRNLLTLKQEVDKNKYINIRIRKK